MKKILLLCESNKEYSYDLAPKFHGWLMEHISFDAAEYFHLSQVNPYSLRVLSNKGSNILLELVTLDEYAEKVFDVILLTDSLNEIILGNNAEIHLKILAKDVVELPQEKLTELFYSAQPKREIEIEFLTATSFKAHGSFVFMPDVLLMFQNLMLRYTMIFENNTSVDKELLQEIIDKTKIVSFSIRSSYFPIHGRYIPGFIGKVKLRCNGSKTLINYVNMLLRFAEYSGVGIKTSMGMGAVRIRMIR